MNKPYNVFLGETNIGTTLLEKADAPIGVVFGNITFIGIASPYTFFKDYCIQHHLRFTEYPEMHFIATFDIPDLMVVNDEGVAIKGISTEISGEAKEGFKIYLLGVPYPLYGEEFPHHVENYDK